MDWGCRTRWGSFLVVDDVIVACRWGYCRDLDLGRGSVAIAVLPELIVGCLQLLAMMGAACTLLEWEEDGCRQEGGAVDLLVLAVDLRVLAADVAAVVGEEAPAAVVAADVAGDGGDGLRSRSIRRRPVITDLLDGSDPPSGESPVWVMAHCIDGEDATTVGGGSSDLEKTNVAIILVSSDRWDQTLTGMGRTTAMAAAHDDGDGAPYSVL
ncbi:hypothetical protein ACLOJK_025591 [Asimina triloba]